MDVIKKIDLSQYEKKIIPIIKKYDGIIHTSDIALETDLPMIHIKYVLNKLANEYLADVIVDNNGELTYRFPKKLKLSKKKASPFSIFKYILFYLFTIFKVTMKITIMLMLVSYSLIIVTVFLFISTIVYLIAIMDSKSSYTYHDTYNTSSTYYDDDKDENELKLSSLVDFINSVISIYDFTDNKEQKPFYLQIFSFIFGDKQNIINFDDERNILLFIKKNKRVVLSDIINLTGFDENKAQQIILDIVTKYDGEIRVSKKSGIIYYEFDNLNFKRDNIKGRKKFSYIWERKLDIPKYNLNSPKVNLNIFILNSLILSVSSFITFGDFSNIFIIGKYYENSFFHTWFGIIPFIYSILVFLIPFLRGSSIKKKRKKVDFINRFYYLLNEFAYNLKTNFVPSDQTDNDIEEYLNQSYKSLMKKDFYKNKQVINLTRYHREIYFSSKGNPENINILDPEEVDFLDF